MGVGQAMGKATGRTCRSSHHDPQVPAAVVGTFDCSMLNGNQPEPDSAYCLRCAVVLADVGYFATTDGTVLPDLVTYLNEREPAAVSAGDNRRR